MLCALLLSTLACTTAPATVQHEARIEHDLARLRRALVEGREDPVPIAGRLGSHDAQDRVAPMLFELLDLPEEMGIRPRALAALDQLGEDAAEALRRLVAERHAWRARYGHLGRPYALKAHLALLDQPYPELRLTVALALDSMGPEAVERSAFGARLARLVDDLTATDDDPDPALGYWADFAMAGLDPGALPYMVAALRGGDRHLRRLAAESIARVVPNLSLGRCELRHEDLTDWRGPCWSEPASPIPEQVATALPELGAALGDEDEYVRYFAARALYKLGAWARGAEPELTAACGDSSPGVRMWARDALKRVRPGDFPVVRSVAAAAEPRVQDRAEKELVLVLDRLDNGSAWTVDDDGLRLVWPQELDEPYEAAWELAAGWSERWLASEPRDEERQAALVRMEREIGRHLSDLLRLLDDEWSPGGPAARKLVDAGRPALPFLAHDFLRYPRFPIGLPTYDELTWVLARIGTDAIPTLVEGLEHWHSSGPTHASSGLYELGPRALAAVPAILSDLRFCDRCELSEEIEVPTRWWRGLVGNADLHALTLAAVGEDVVPYLLDAAEDERPLVRAVVVRAAGLLDARNVAVDEMVSALRADRDARVRREAERALASRSAR